jgi:hypothetical protein
MAPHVKGDHIIAHLLTRVEEKEASFWVNPHHGALNKGSASVLHHLLYVKAHLFWFVNTGKQSRTHTGIIVIGVKADQGHVVSALGIMIKL